MKRVGSLLALSLFGLAAVWPSAVLASRVSPMIIDMTPTGRASVGRVELTNDADRAIAYEVQMMRGDVSLTGELALTPADEQFLVFPPQSLIEANSQQVFRIQYVGEEALDASQIYYLAIRRVPVAFDEGQNQVQVVVNYNVLVNVVPDGTNPQPTVRDARYIERPKKTDNPADSADTSDDGEAPAVSATERGLLVDLGNDGSRYFFAGRANWAITAQTTEGKPFELKLAGRDVSQHTGVGVVGPGKTRQFFIPIEEALVTETIRLNIEL